MTIVTKKVSYKKKNLQEIPLTIPSPDLIGEIDFSYNPIISFQNLPLLENLTILEIDSTKIETFHYAPYFPNLKSFSCRNTPLGQSSYIGLMSAIVLSNKLKLINNNPLDDRKMKIANYYRDQYRGFFADGYLILNLSPIRIFNPETRKRQTIFGDFSKVPKTSASSSTKNTKALVPSTSPSKIPRSNHTVSKNTSTSLQPPVKKKNKQVISETTKSTKKTTNNVISETKTTTKMTITETYNSSTKRVISETTKSTTKKSTIAKSPTSPHSSKPKHVETVIEVFDDTENEGSKFVEDQRLKSKYLAFTKHLLKQTVKQRRDIKNGIIPRKKTPLQLELESNDKNSDYSDDEFYGKRSKYQIKPSEILVEEEEIQENVQEEEHPEQEQHEEEHPEQEQHEEKHPEQEQHEEKHPEQEQHEEEHQEQEQHEEEHPEQEQHEEEHLEQKQYEEEHLEQKQYEEEHLEQEQYEEEHPEQEQHEEEHPEHEQNNEEEEEHSKQEKIAGQDDQQYSAQYSDQYSDQEPNQSQSQNPAIPLVPDQIEVNDYGYYSDEYDDQDQLLDNNNVPNNNVSTNNAPPNTENNKIATNGIVSYDSIANNNVSDKPKGANGEYDYYSEEEFDEVKV